MRTIYHLSLCLENAAFVQLLTYEKSSGISLISRKKKTNYATESISFQRLSNDFCMWQLKSAATEPILTHFFFSSFHY